MIRITQIFLADFIMMILPTLSSTTAYASVTSPFTLTSGALTSSMGSHSICEGEHPLPSSSGISSITTGASILVSSTFNTSYTLECLKTTEMYLETMDEEQLHHLIGKLEEKEISFSLEETHLLLKKREE